LMNHTPNCFNLSLGSSKCGFYVPGLTVELQLKKGRADFYAPIAKRPSFFTITVTYGFPGPCSLFSKDTTYRTRSILDTQSAIWHTHLVENQLPIFQSRVYPRSTDIARSDLHPCHCCGTILATGMHRF
jgi:hypothetical protein